MGIPAFFRWISEKYPNIMADCIEEALRDEHTGQFQPIDASTPNPNGIEYDNLYLDMNGIIHPCTHPEDRPPPTTEEEMFDAVCDYIDRLFAIVRPRKLIYLAVDGVAPRAKINQQRSRRFRSAQEAEEKLRVADELREEWSKMGLSVTDHTLPTDRPDHDDSEKGKPFDSNVITPGTPFMQRLSIALRKFVAKRVAHDPAWTNIVVIFSDSSVPGEGEHKIAEFIRRQRTHPSYNPNLRHVMYGLDADLIMLALATHEVYFTILREEVIFKGNRRNDSRSRSTSNSHKQQQSVSQIDGAMAAAKQKDIQTLADVGGRKPFLFLHVNVLREYLDYEFRHDIEGELSAAAKPVTDLAYDLERVIDDFVFMCFFVGNDFLPHLPTLDIREGAIEYLMELYKTELVHVGYLTSQGGQVDFVRVRHLLAKMAPKESDLFKSRAIREQNFSERQRQEKRARETSRGNEGGSAKSRMENVAHVSTDVSDGRPSKRTSNVAARSKDQGYLDAASNMQTVQLGRKGPERIGSGEAKAAAEAALQAALHRKEGKGSSSVLTGEASSDVTTLQGKNPNIANKEACGDGAQQTASDGDGDGDAAKKRDAVVEKSKAEFDAALKQRIDAKNELEVVDTVKLGQDGWKARYYEQKFAWGESFKVEKLTLLRKYYEGLQWVMRYYYVGCVSWGWYFPYHYAPFASDLIESDVTSADFNFELGEPFEPFSQLQAVMPASSGRLVLPKCYADLMSDPKSPIIDYYPTDFQLDLNGKRYAHQGVVLLPFIDEKRLADAMNPLRHLLNDDEKKRNSFGDSHVIVNRKTRLGSVRTKRSAGSEVDMKKIPVEAADGLMFGRASYPLEEFGGHEDTVLTLKFALPPFKAHYSDILAGANRDLNSMAEHQKANDLRHGGWRGPRNGPLGTEARTLIMARQQRLRDNRFRGRRGRSHTPHAHASRGGNRAAMAARPVINGPPQQGNNGMFAALGASSTHMPGWMNPQVGYGSGHMPYGGYPGSQAYVAGAQGYVAGAQGYGSGGNPQSYDPTSQAYVSGTQPYSSAGQPYASNSQMMYGNGGGNGGGGSNQGYDGSGYAHQMGYAQNDSTSGYYNANATAAARTYNWAGSSAYVTGNGGGYAHEAASGQWMGYGGGGGGGGGRGRGGGGGGGGGGGNGNGRGNRGGGRRGLSGPTANALRYIHRGRGPTSGDGRGGGGGATYGGGWDGQRQY